MFLKCMTIKHRTSAIEEKCYKAEVVRGFIAPMGVIIYRKDRIFNERQTKATKFFFIFPFFL